MRQAPLKHTNLCKNILDAFIHCLFERHTASANFSHSQHFGFEIVHLCENDQYDPI